MLCKRLSWGRHVNALWQINHWSTDGKIKRIWLQIVFHGDQVCNMHGTHGMSNGCDEHGLVPHGKTPIPSGKNSNTNWLATDM